MNSIQDLSAWAIEKYFGMPYQWGGQGPPTHYGIDCSGLVQRILARVSLDPPGDQTAAELFAFAQKNWVPDVRARGAVAFFGSADRIVHCGWMIDALCMLNASGGGSHITSLQQAAQAKANVKIQPVDWFKMPAFVKCFMPDYGRSGLC